VSVRARERACGQRPERLPLGTGWQDVDAGLVNRDALTVAFDPADPTRLVAGTNGAGVYELRLPPSRRAPAPGRAAGQQRT
jgi:hypothetical protein